MKRYNSLNYPSDGGTEELFTDGHVIVTEKLDGGNGRFMLEDHLSDEYHTNERDLVFGSRNVVYKNPSDEKKQFADPMNFVREEVNVELLRWYDDSLGGIVIFGEYMEPHTIQNYDDEVYGTFIGFDVWLMDMQEFMDADDALELIEDIGLPTSPIIAEIGVDDWNNGDTQFHDDAGDFKEDDEWCPQSNFGDVQAEGLVLKNPVTDTYAKLVRSSFKEKNNKTFNSKPTEPSGADKLLYNYVTNARIRKAVHRLIDEGSYEQPKMEMMGDGLPQNVVADMIDEEGVEIFMGENYTVDLQEFRSDLSSRCATILQKMCNENRRDKL